MITAIVDPPSRTRLRPSPVAQPARRRTPTHGPLARPERLAPVSPSRLGDVDFARGSTGVVSPRLPTVRGCWVGAVSRPSASWRLTDRGIALILALTAVILVAAVTVIGLTAWRVTGPGYRAGGVSQLSLR